MLFCFLASIGCVSQPPEASLAASDEFNRNLGKMTFWVQYCHQEGLGSLTRQWYETFPDALYKWNYAVGIKRTPFEVAYKQEAALGPTLTRTTQETTCMAYDEDLIAVTARLEKPWYRNVAAYSAMAKNAEARRQAKANPAPAPVVIEFPEYIWVTPVE